VPASDPGPVHLAAGIARPDRFERAARAAGHRVTGRTWWSGYHVPSRRDLDDLARRAAGSSAVLVTAKDAPRFPGRVGDVPVRVLATRLRILSGEDALVGALDAALGRS
jgi:tetraacyldisaccharide-1-P 4'-kinase